MIKKNRHNQSDRKYYRINERIFASQLRVLDSENKQIGIMSKFDALKKAKDEGLDLVEIASQAKPPVAKIVDYQKFLYQEEKRKREEKRKAKVATTKEVRLGPFMSDNDLGVMARRAREFLENGDKVRFVVKFRGREITRTDFGLIVVRKVVDLLSDVSKVDKEAKLEGRQMVAIVSPERKKQHAEKKDQEISTQ